MRSTVCEAFKISMLQGKLDEYVPGAMFTSRGETYALYDSIAFKAARDMMRIEYRWRGALISFMELPRQYISALNDLTMQLHPPESGGWIRIRME